MPFMKRYRSNEHQIFHKIIFPNFLKVWLAFVSVSGNIWRRVERGGFYIPPQRKWISWISIDFRQTMNNIWMNMFKIDDDIIYRCKCAGATAPEASPHPFLVRGSIFLALNSGLLQCICCVLFFVLNKKNVFFMCFRLFPCVCSAWTCFPSDRRRAKRTKRPPSDDWPR